MAIGRIPENILEDILSRIDIVELISGYIPLKRAGRNFKAVCPFHHEKTPSFMVSPDKQIYHCFGCNAGGNAFNFLMQYERLEFLEAVSALAKKAGVVLPQTNRQDSATASLSEQLYRANELTASFYARNLSSSGAAHARQYLLRRGLKEETIKLFKLGYCPDKWDALISELRAKNISLSVLEKAGLIVGKQGGGYYDRFRNRIIFPICDIKSRVLGFGARVLDESLPKYINSPETGIYIKGRNLYGLNLAKDAIRDNDYALVVEGYLDCIIPYQEGLKNIVASQGTALTYEQVKLLRRYTRNVVIVYDPDKAGEIATLRALDIFIEEGISVKVVSLPQGLDPDAFVRKNGIDNFKDNIQTAETLFDYKLKVLKVRYNARDTEGKAKICAEMLPTINKFKDAILKSEYLKKLAQDLDVAEGALLQELNKLKDNSTYPEPVKNSPGKITSINPTEKLLIKLMLEERDLIEHLKNRIEPADFQDERISRIVSIMFDLIGQGKDVEPNKLINQVGDNDILQLICETAFGPEIHSQDDKDKIINDCVCRLKNEKLKVRKQRLHEEIKSAQHVGDQDRLNRLMQEFHNLVKISSGK